MIDVVFQLLLFFLLGCRFIQEEGQLQANLPPIAGPDEIPALQVDPIRISLRATGRDDRGVLIEITGTDVAYTEIPKLYKYLVHLKRRQAEGDDVPVFINPLGRVRWTFVVDAFNQAIRAEYKTIGFAQPGT